jgi:hypothetical protein
MAEEQQEVPKKKEPLASLVYVQDVEKHPNPKATKLCVVTFQTNFNRVIVSVADAIRPNDVVVLIRPDNAVGDLPDTASEKTKEWHRTLNATFKQRIAAIQLLGEWSYGVAFPLEDVFSKEEIPALLEGLEQDGEKLERDVSKELGVYHYVSSSSLSSDGGGLAAAAATAATSVATSDEEAAELITRALEGQKLTREEQNKLKYKPIPSFLPRTDEDRWQALSKKGLKYLIGSHVDISLKLDGSSFSFAVVLTPDKTQVQSTFITSRNNIVDKGIAIAKKDMTMKRVVDWAEQTNILEKLSTFCLAHRVSLCLRGEAVGPDFQKKANNYWNRVGVQVRFFSCYNFDTKSYETPQSPLYYRIVCKCLDLLCVPLKEKQSILTMDLIEKWSKTVTTVIPDPDDPTLPADPWPFEGVVVCGSDPLAPNRYFSFKIISMHYDAISTSSVSDAADADADGASSK